VSSKIVPEVTCYYFVVISNLYPTDKKINHKRAYKRKCVYLQKEIFEYYWILKYHKNHIIIKKTFKQK